MEKWKQINLTNTLLEKKTVCKYSGIKVFIILLLIFLSMFYFQQPDFMFMQRIITLLYEYKVMLFLFLFFVLKYFLFYQFYLLQKFIETFLSYYIKTLTLYKFFSKTKKKVDNTSYLSSKSRNYM